MIERMVIFSSLVIVSVAAWRFFNALHVRRAAVGAGSDPLLANFSQGIPGVLLFTADYCYPCKAQQQPAILRLLEEIGTDRMQFIQVDVETNPEVAERWGVLSLPTTFILDETGTPRDVNHGVTPTEKLKRQLEAVQRIA